MTTSTTLEIESIKEYLISVGCKIEYPILVNAFKKHLYNPDPNIQGKVRNMFKDYVNRLATVSLENNMKFIILRPELRPPEYQQLSTTQKQNINPPQKQSPPKSVTGHATNEDKRIAVSNGQSKPAKSDQKRQKPAASLTATPSKPQHLAIHPTNIRQQDLLDNPRNLQDKQQSTQYITQHSPIVNQQMFSTQVTPLLNADNNARNQYNHQKYDHQNGGSSQSKTPKLVDHSSNINQSNDLPPTLQFHSRTQSQPITSPNHSMEQSHYPSHQHQIAHLPLSPISNNIISNSIQSIHSIHDDSAFLMPPPPPPHSSIANQHLTSSPLRIPLDQSGTRQDTPVVKRAPSSVSQQQMPPPRPPPRRRQSTASLFKPSPLKPIEKVNREQHDLARKSISGRVKEHASRFNSASTNDLSTLMPKRNCSMKENRLSRESVFNGLASALQRNGSQLTTRSRSSHRGEDESDSSSLQPIDPLRRRWAIEACNCNYNNLIALLREDPKLASCKDIVNGYTALHWAAKFGNLDIIKLIAGSYQVPANVKSSAGYTPLHVAYMFNRLDAANLLSQSYQASLEVRDHSGKKPKQYWQKAQ